MSVRDSIRSSKPWEWLALALAATVLVFSLTGCAGIKKVANSASENVSVLAIASVAGGLVLFAFGVPPLLALGGAASASTATLLVQPPRISNVYDVHDGGMVTVPASQITNLKGQVSTMLDSYTGLQSWAHKAMWIGIWIIVGYFALRNARHIIHFLRWLARGEFVLAFKTFIHTLLPTKAPPAPGPKK